MSKSQARKYQLEVSLHNNSSFIYNESEIATEVKPGEDIGNAINRLIRVIHSVEHLVYTAKVVGIKFFKEEVAEFLNKNHIKYHMDI